MASEPPVSVLVLCAHNRTRSVMAAGLLKAALPADGFQVHSAGFGPAGFPATPETIRLLADNGIDASAHRSTTVTRAVVADADRVLCAERQHVLDVVANLGGAFQRTFTLPEFAQGAGLHAPRVSGIAYLHASVPEVTDPTGRSAATWQRVWSELQDWCSAAANRLKASQ